MARRSLYTQDMNAMNKTLTIETGRRVWNLTATASTGRYIWAESNSGKTYRIDVRTGTLQGRNQKTRKDAKGSLRSYDWNITNMEAIMRAWRPANVKPASKAPKTGKAPKGWEVYFDEGSYYFGPTDFGGREDGEHYSQPYGSASMALKNCRAEVKKRPGTSLDFAERTLYADM